MKADFLIVGAGMAGASIAYWLAPRGRVVVLERESQLGYHATGRSAAIYHGSYGNAQVRALTQASRAFLRQPPDGFAPQALLAPRGVMMVATAGQQARLAEHQRMLQAMGAAATWLDGRGARERVPVLREDVVVAAIHEEDAFDIDVHALHQGYLRGLRNARGSLVCDAEVTAIRYGDKGWQVTAAGQSWEAPVLVNAAGAWCDVLAGLAGVRPLGLQPCRRSAFVFKGPAGLDFGRWPMVASIAEDWYFKPDAGLLFGSPANADPVPPQDVQPEELDIALAADRLERATTLRIGRPVRTWAGLRSFVADGGLVGGFDAQAPSFFWLAGQGGYGIQTSPAMGQACAALAAGEPIPHELAAFGISAEALAPGRLR